MVCPLPLPSQDIYSFVENALFPALLSDEWPMTEPPQKKTAAEIAEAMDMFDWSAGLSFRQARQHGQSGRLGEALAGLQQLLSLHLKASGCPPHSGEATCRLGPHREAVTFSQAPPNSPIPPRFATQARASAEPDSTCGTYQTMQMYTWLLTQNDATKVDGLTFAELEKTPRRFGTTAHGQSRRLSRSWQRHASRWPHTPRALGSSVGRRPS